MSEKMSENNSEKNRSPIPCEIIQDLLPSYIDGLTSPVTNGAIEEHVAGCSRCRQVLETMRQPDGSSENTDDLPEKREIDFLKKTRKRTRKAVVGSLMAAVLIIVIAFAGKAYFIGSSVGTEGAVCSFKVDGNKLSLTAEASGDNKAISAVHYTEKDGIVTISLRAVTKSFIHDEEAQSEYAASEKIVQVRIGSQIVWDHGMNISSLTNAVYQTRHDYVGSMPENAETAGTMNMVWRLGGYHHELQTEQEPYGWTMILDEPVSEQLCDQKEQDMRKFAYVLLGVTGNLGEVSYRYICDDEECTLTVTEADASDYLGSDIKECGQNISRLETLIEKTGLADFSYSVYSSGSRYKGE